MSMQTARAVSYLRVSTVGQTRTDFNEDGLSLLAQREAVERKAQALGAQIVEEYVDRGESAKVADRPALKKLLERLRDRRDLDYVIVHKFDRFARNTLDHLQMLAEIRRCGAQLVSVTENIDDTPLGQFMQVIVAAQDEMYSANLSREARKGMRQKAKLGGTPATAPLGYLNVVQQFEGKRVRTVEVDEERAEHVRWAFRQYATGEWTMAGLAEALEARGLRTRPGGKGNGPNPLGVSQIQRMLHNRYYTGVVTYEGVQYAGRHEPLVDLQLFEVVQRVFNERRVAGERPIRHHHYLKGTVFCGRCGGRLTLSFNRGRRGGLYGYFMCLNRQREPKCTLPHVAIENVEALVEDYWATVRPSDEKLATVLKQIGHHIKVIQKLSARELKAQQARVERLDGEERKLLSLYYADGISLALMQQEQQRISTERRQAAQLLEVGRLRFEDIEAEVEAIAGTLADGHRLYLAASPQERRTLNQAVFERLWVTDEGVVGANLRPGFAHLSQDDLTKRLRQEAKTIETEGLPGRTYERSAPALPTDEEFRTWLAMELDFSEVERPFGRLAGDSKNPAVFGRQGSNVLLVVGAEGLEPPTPSL